MSLLFVGTPYFLIVDSAKEFLVVLLSIKNFLFAFISLANNVITLASAVPLEPW